MKAGTFLFKVDNLKGENVRLYLLVVALAAALIVESVVVVYSASSQRTVITPPYIDRQFYVAGDSASPEYIQMMSRYAIELVTNYTPDTAKPRIDEFMRFIAPSQYNAVYPELAVIAKEAKDNTISQYFIPQRIVLQGNRVTAKGMLTRYVQDKQTYSAQAEYSLVFGINSGRFEIESYQKVESQRSGG
jgi:conjugal transfer pilus assembly protein TraE